MKKKWRDAFRITGEENPSFDTAHSDHIEAYIKINSQRIKTHEKSYFTRLKENNHRRHQKSDTTNKK